jgi:hypothetical protein
MVDCWTPVDWPQYLPDLNLLDFSIWSMLWKKVQERPQSDCLASTHHQGVELDITSLHPPDPLLFQPPPEAIMATNGAYIK